MLIYLVLPVVKHFRSFDEAFQDGFGRYFGERPDPVFQRPVDNNNRSLSTTSGGCNTPPQPRRPRGAESNTPFIPKDISPHIQYFVFSEIQQTLL